MAHVGLVFVGRPKGMSRILDQGHAMFGAERSDAIEPVGVAGEMDGDQYVGFATLGQLRRQRFRVDRPGRGIDVDKVDGGAEVAPRIGRRDEAVGRGPEKSTWSKPHCLADKVQGRGAVGHGHRMRRPDIGRCGLLESDRLRTLRQVLGTQAIRDGGDVVLAYGLAAIGNAATHVGPDGVTQAATGIVFSIMTRNASTVRKCGLVPLL